MLLTDIATLAQPYREPSSLPTDADELMELMGNLSIHKPKSIYRENPESVIYVHKALKVRTTEYGNMYPYLAEDLTTDEPDPWFILGLNKPYIKPALKLSYVPFHVGVWHIDGEAHDAIIMLPCKRLAKVAEA